MGLALVRMTKTGPGQQPPSVLLLHQIPLETMTFFDFAPALHFIQFPRLRCHPSAVTRTSNKCIHSAFELWTPDRKSFFPCIPLTSMPILKPSSNECSRETAASMFQDYSYLEDEKALSDHAFRPPIPGCQAIGAVPITRSF